LDFLGEIDKESFEREKRIRLLETKLKTTKILLEKKIKKKQTLEKSTERLSKKMTEYLNFSKTIKLFKDLKRSVQIMLRHFCKVNKSNYEMGLEDALDKKMEDVAILGNRVKIGNRLLKNSTFQSKIKNFWELKISWRRLFNVNFMSIHDTFKKCAENPEDPNLFMLSVIVKFCKFLEGVEDITENIPDSKDEKDDTENKIDFEFSINFFKKYNSNTFLNKLQKFKFIDLANEQIVKLTRQIILFEHQTSLEKVYSKEISLLSSFIKRFLLYIDKEIKFINKVLHKGDPESAKLLNSKMTVGFQNSCINDYLQELFKEFFSQEDAVIYLEHFQHNFILKKQNGMMEDDIIKIDKELKDLLEKRRQSQSIGAKLSFEVQEWKTELRESEKIRTHLEGNCLMALSILEFCPRFPRKVRKELVRAWERELEQQGLSTSDNFDLADFMLTPMGKEKIKFKELHSLNDHFEDIFSLEESDLFCALVDPHCLIQNFLPDYFNDLEPVVLRVSDPSANLVLKKAVLTGQLLILLKDVAESVNPAVLRLLEKDVKEEKNQEMLDLGDKVCKIHENFRCYLVVNDENCLQGDLANLVKIVNLKEFVEIEMEEHLVGVLRSREIVSNEELRKGLLYEKLEEKFQVDSLKNDLLGKILDHLRESQTEEEPDTELKIMELQEDLVNVAEALNITKLTIRERKKETDTILLEIDYRREEMIMLVHEFKQIYLLHKNLQREGKAQGIGVMQMFEVFFPINQSDDVGDTWKKESENKNPISIKKLNMTEGAEESTHNVWINSEGLEESPDNRNRLRDILQKLIYSVEPESRESFLLNSCIRLSIIKQKSSPELLGIFLIIIKQIYLKNLNTIKTIRKQKKFNDKPFWRTDPEEIKTQDVEQIAIPGWKIHQMCEDMGFNSKLVYNLIHRKFSMSGKEGLHRFFETEWIVKNKIGVNQKALGQIEADKLILVSILESLSYGKWEGLFDKVKQNLIKQKNKGGILCKETMLKDLIMPIKGEHMSPLLKLVVMLIFNPERLDELAKEYVTLELGHVQTDSEGDWELIREKMFEEKNCSLLVRVDPSDKLELLDRVVDVSFEKEVVLVKQGGLFPVNREFLIEYSKKSNYNKCTHSSEENNFWKIEENLVSPRPFKRKDLLEFLKKTQFQGKSVLIDTANDRQFLSIVCDLVMELRKEGDESEEGTILVLYHTQEDLPQPLSIKKSFDPSLREINSIEGEFFTCKSNVFNRVVPVSGFSAWAHFKAKKTLKYVFEKNFKELIQEILELEEEFNINEHDSSKNNSKGSESHYDGNNDSNSVKSNSMQKLDMEEKKSNFIFYEFCLLSII
jgi:hypothetical protein